jgi:uncharacterized phage protein (predicted DNA packaging)
MLDLVKSALKIDGDETESDVKLLIDAAIEDLEASGVPRQTEGKETALYKRAVIIYSILNYENYDKTLNVVALNNSLQSIILKIKSYGGEMT